MSKHKLCPAPPPRCIHVYSQGWACKRVVERDGLCRVHHPGLTSLALVPDVVVEVSEPEVEAPEVDAAPEADVVRLDVAVAEAAPLDMTGDERAAIALLALFVERAEDASVEGVPLAHAVTLARGFLRRTRRRA